MPFIKENASLKEYNTFGIEAKAEKIIRFTTISDLLDFLTRNNIENKQWMALGQGSNLLFMGDYKGMILIPDFKEITVISETEKDVTVKVGSGVVWDDFVGYAVNKGWGGVENLSDIPGTVGASPIQNIGAYGVEVKNTIEKVIGIDVVEKSTSEILNKNCLFDYRSSIFKNELKNRFIITSVVFKLSKEKEKINTSYSKLHDEVLKYGEITLGNIRKAVKTIRAEKLPNYNELGNAGSFFKNPIVEKTRINKLKESYIDLPEYPIDNKTSKVSAAYMIDACGWKGKKINNVSCYEKQPLVIVNHGNASGDDIIAYAEKVRQSVREQFEIELEYEVNIISL